jgi:hypothetical protein
VRPGFGQTFWPEVLPKVRKARLGPAGGMPFDDQFAAVDGSAGLTVGHENIRADVSLRQASPQSEVLLRSRPTAVTNVLAGYSQTQTPP